MDESVVFERPTQGQVDGDLRELFRGTIRLTLEMLLAEVVKDMVGARRYERIGSRKDSRNGTYLRRLLTSMGLIELGVPRTRDSGSAGEVLGAYKRRSGELDEAICQAYVNGVSTRKMEAVVKSLAETGVSASTVSRITERLDAKVEELRSMPISEPITYLYLDATFLDARWARKVENVSALVAYGVDNAGKRRLLGVSMGSEESEDSWSELLRQLCERGLHGVRLVIADDHKGIEAAIRHLLPEAERQRCTVHLQRNMLHKIPQRLRARLAPRFSQLFKAKGLKEAQELREKLAGEFGSLIPEAFEILDRGWAAATRFYRFPKEHWVRLRTTNGLERLHGEIKRRIRAVGVFPDRDSALRLITAVALQSAATWEDRRYLDMSLLKAKVMNENEAA
jgi:transposase-like protein